MLYISFVLLNLFISKVTSLFSFSLDRLFCAKSSEPVLDHFEETGASLDIKTTLRSVNMS